MEAFLSELDCLEDLLTPSQDLYQQGGRKSWGLWVLLWKVCVQRSVQGSGETQSVALQCPVAKGTHGEVEGQTFDGPQELRCGT